MGAERSRWVCSLPGLDRCPRQQVATPSGALIPVRRPHRTRFLRQDARDPADRLSRPQTSPPACWRFRVTGDAEPPGL